MRPELDRLPVADVVGLVLDAEAKAVPAVRVAAPAIAAAAELVADRWSAGGRLVFVGAGTSGRIASAEAAELPGTFGLSRERVIALLAGGTHSTDDDEDDLEAAARDVAALLLRSGDVVIAVAASGSTPYTLAVADVGVAAGADLIAVVTVPGSPLAGRATVAVEAVVGAEALRGSTRLAAGSAQKAALNALTTAAMARAGHVHGDLMIDVVPANAKLRLRSAGIVAEIAGTSVDEALLALERCQDDARAAVFHLLTGLEPDVSLVRRAAHRSLREALQAHSVSGG